MNNKSLKDKSAQIAEEKANAKLALLEVWVGSREGLILPVQNSKNSSNVFPFYVTKDD